MHPHHDFTDVSYRFHLRKDRDLEVRSGEFSGCQRGKSWILDRGGEGVVRGELI
jgi:hypothetical protein